MTDGERVPSEAIVWRMPKNKPTLVSQTERLPTPSAFVPSTDELATTPTRVSVWHKDAITIERAKVLRGSNEPVAVFELSVVAVDKVAGEFTRPDVQVVGDPAGTIAVATDDDRKAHLGIEGLRSDQMPRVDGRKSTDRWRSMLGHIANACVMIEPDPPGT